MGEIILNLKEKYDDIKLYCIIPCENQMERWNENYKYRYNNLINNCTAKIILQKDFTKDCYLKRNKFLVDKCTTLVGIYNGIDKNSGTYFTLDYALKQNKNIIYINSNNFEITEVRKYI